MSDLTEGEVLGNQKDDHSTWHKQERRRSLKALTWVEAKTTMPNQLLFSHTLGPVMKLHHTLFKYAQLSPEGNAKSYLFDCLRRPCLRDGQVPGRVNQLVGRLCPLGPIGDQAWPGGLLAGLLQGHCQGLHLQTSGASVATPGVALHAVAFASGASCGS